MYHVKEEIQKAINLLDGYKERSIGWGPERHVYDKSEFVPYPTINSKKDNPVIGDERAFVYVKKHGDREFGTSILEIVPEEQYDVRIYYTNNADANLGNQFSCAKEVKMSTYFSTVLKKNEKGEIGGVITSTNCSPEAVWAQRYVKTNYGKIYLRYVAGTAVIHCDGAIDGMHLSEDLFSSEGTYIGIDELDGSIKVEKGASNYVEYTIEAEERAGTITQAVSYDGINYQDSIVVSSKSDVYYRVTLLNLGDKPLTNVVIKGLFSSGLSIIPGSVSLMANNSGKHDRLSDNYDKGGYNLGTVGTGNEISIFYKCRVSDDMNPGDAMISSALLVYDSESKEGDQKQAVTVVRISNGSITPWGPKRKTFTNANPSLYVTFNSITDNAGVGDERNFVRVREANANDKFRDEVKVIAGKIYEVYIYYQNDASPSLANSPKGIARDVKVRSSFPKVISAEKKHIVTGTLSASNSIPVSVWDGAYLTADEELILQYVPHSLRLHSYTETHGQVLDARELFSEEGTLISTHIDQPGIITSKSGEDSGHITYCLIATKEEQLMEVSLQISLDGKNWFDKIAAKPGEYVSIKAILKNVGFSKLTNVICKAEFDEGLSLRCGSTVIFDSHNSKGKAIDDIIDISGYNTGDKEAGALTQVLYQIRVSNDNAFCGTSLNNTFLLDYNGKTQKRLFVTIDVSEQ